MLLLYFCFKLLLKSPEAITRSIPRLHREIKRNSVDWDGLLARGRLEGVFSPGQLDGSNVHIWVIALSRYRWRRQNTLASLKEQGLAFSVFEAIDGLGHLSPEAINLYAGRKKKRRLATTLKWSVIELLELQNKYSASQLQDARLRSALHERLRFGCYMSHISLWKQAVHENLPYMVVLEDDVVLANNFTLKLQRALQTLPKSWGLLYLNGSHRKFGRRYNSGIFQSKGGVGAFGYVISASACAHFLAGPALRSDKAIDHVMDWEVLSGRITAFHMDPPIVYIVHGFDSTLAY